MDQVTVTLVVDLTTAFENVQLKVVWAWAMHFVSLQRIIRVFCGNSTSEEHFSKAV